MGKRTFTGQTVRLNKLIADIFVKAYKEAVETSGYKPKVVYSYVPRHVSRDPTKSLSVHSFGMAFDFDSTLNPMCKTCTNGIIRKYPKFIDIMNKYGFLWGGDFTYYNKAEKRRKPYPDDMHFEFDIKRLGFAE